MNKILWIHPRLMDYRLPLFNMMIKEYQIYFFLKQSSDFDNYYNNVTICKSNKHHKRIFHEVKFDDIKFLKEHVRKVDIVISSFLLDMYSLIAIYYSWRFKKKIVIWSELTLTTKRNIKFWVYFFIQRKISKHCDSFFVLGEIQYNALLKLGVDCKKIFRANEYPGYNYSKLRQIPFDLGIPAGRKIILYMGRLIEVKGIDKLLHAFRNLEQSRDDVYLLIVGSGPDESKLKTLAANLKIINIKFLGPIYEIERKAYLFDQAFIGVVSSIVTGNKADGGPLIVLEYLSAGLPVLASNKLGSSNKFIIEGFNGLTYCYDNIQEMTMKFQQLISNVEDKSILKETIIKSFSQIKGHELQYEVLRKSINYCLS